MALKFLSRRGGVSSSPEYAESLEWLNENGDASKMYVLPDGYLYAKKEITAPDFTNLYNISDIALNVVRSGTNGGTLTDKVGVLSTGLIPINCSSDTDNPTKIYIRGIEPLSWQDNSDRISYYNTSGE